MANAILIHGACDKEEYFNTKIPSLSNSHWFPWLQKQLIVKGILTQTPEMPNAYIPNYDDWKNELERHLINEETILVGHSCGGGFLVRWLSENNIRVGKVILVAPWLDPERMQTKDFFEFQFDSQLVNKTNGISLFVSNNDDVDILKSVDIILSKIPQINVINCLNKGHFTFDDMGTNEFFELLKIIL